MSVQNVHIDNDIDAWQVTMYQSISFRDALSDNYVRIIVIFRKNELRSFLVSLVIALYDSEVNV